MSGSGDESIDVDGAIDYAEDAENLGGTFSKRVMALFAGTIAFAFGAIMAPIEAMVELVTGLIGAFGQGGEDWITVMTSGTADFLGASLEQGAAGFSNTAFSELGPFLPWIGVIVAIGVVFIITWYLDRRDSDVVGLGVDLPVIGNDEDGDVSDEVE